MRKIRYLNVLALMMLTVVATTAVLASCNRSYDMLYEATGKRIAPSADATVKYDVNALMNAEQTDIDKAIALLLHTVYNMMATEQYYFHSKVSTSGTNYSLKSEGVYLREGTDYYRQAISYLTNGTVKTLNSFINSGSRKVRYGDQLFSEETAKTKYNKNNDKVWASWRNKPETSTVTVSGDDEDTYQLFKRFDFTLDLSDKTQIAEAVISDAVDENENEYYILQITTDVERLNASSYTLECLAQNNLPATDTEYNELTLTVEIWNNGLLRSITVHEKWKCKMLFFSQDCETTRVYEFSYYDVDCSIAKAIRDCGYVKYLNEEQKARQGEAYNALSLA